MDIRIDPEKAELLAERGIGVADVEKVMIYAQETGNVFRNRTTGRYLAYCRPSKITFWVEWTKEGKDRKLFTAYSHRMKILEGLNIPAPPKGETVDWFCVKCKAPLEPVTVKLKYLDETFAADIPACPSCQRVFVSEKDALEKMALAEKMLEDK